MRILFLSTCFPHATSPVRGTYNRELCEALANHAEVRVVSPRSWTDCVRHRSRLLNDRDITDVPATWPMWFYPPRIMQDRYGQCMWKSIRKHVQQITSDFRPDWVLSYWAHPDGEAALQTARSCGAGSAVIIGGSDVLILPKNPARRPCIEAVLQNSDAVFAISDGLKEAALDLGADADRVHTLRQGINPQQFSHGFKALARRRLKIPVTRPVFLWVGRMVGVKRLDVLLDAFGKFQRVIPDSQLVLAGTGPLQRSLQKETEKRGLSDRVLFAGAVDQSALGDWYRAADAVVLSSDSEGIPNVFRESLACGTPFVSTDVGSVSEIADPASSILTPPGDSQSLFHAMSKILKEEYMQAATEHQDRTWDDTARDCIKLLTTASAAAVGPAANRSNELVAAGTSTN